MRNLFYLETSTRNFLKYDKKREYVPMSEAVGNLHEPGFAKLTDNSTNGISYIDWDSY